MKKKREQRRQEQEEKKRGSDSILEKEDENENSRRKKAIIEKRERKNELLRLEISGKIKNDCPRWIYLFNHIQMLIKFQIINRSSIFLLSQFH